MSRRSAVLLGWMGALLAASCDMPSASIDGGDLRGVFDRDASADAAARADASSPSKGKDAGAPADAGTTLPRTPGEGGCLPPRGAPNRDVRRTLGRPACKNAQVLEWRDADGAPRYACAILPDGAARRAPLPLVLWFHAEWEDPSFVDEVTGLRKHAKAFGLSRDPGHLGFVVLAVQGRALGKRGNVFDYDYTGPDNVDFATVDHFVERISASGLVDPRRIYVMGHSEGGRMAATYAMMRADRIAAVAVVNTDGPAAGWACSSPPPPAFVAYHACDAEVACGDVESWLRALEGLGTDVASIRLGESDEDAPHCAVRNKCSKKKGTAEHRRWPRRRETDVLSFLSRHALAL